jgi:hypothetical protein
MGPDGKAGALSLQSDSARCGRSHDREAYLGPVDELGSGGTFEALPTPLGSLTELLLPPAFPGPAGTPLTPVVPAPAEPALGVPVGLPEVAPAADPPADPPAPCARALTGSIRQAAAAIAIRFDFFDIGFLHMIGGGKRASRTVCSCSKRRAGMEHVGGRMAARRPWRHGHSRIVEPAIMIQLTIGSGRSGAAFRGESARHEKHALNEISAS